MQTPATVAQIIEMCCRLSPSEKLSVVQYLTADLDAALGPEHSAALDNQYQRGYEQVPETVTEVEVLLPHLLLSQEKWE